MKIAIVGPGRSGKDEAALYIQSISHLVYKGSTSEVICPYAAAQLGITPAAAFARRHDDRMLWREIGDRLRQHDPAFLARQTLLGGDICVGVRARKEIEAVRFTPLVDLIVWVDKDVPDDPTLEFDASMADIRIDNHGSLSDLHTRLKRLAASWGILNDVPRRWR